MLHAGQTTYQSTGAPSNFCADTTGIGLYEQAQRSESVGTTSGLVGLGMPALHRPIAEIRIAGDSVVAGEPFISDKSNRTYNGVVVELLVTF